MDRRCAMHFDNKIYNLKHAMKFCSMFFRVNITAFLSNLKPSFINKYRENLINYAFSCFLNI